MLLCLESLHCQAISIFKPGMYRPVLATPGYYFSVAVDMFVSCVHVYTLSLSIATHVKGSLNNHLNKSCILLSGFYVHHLSLIIFRVWP